MADFSFLSDSDNEKAVDELLSQAMDQSILVQIAAINCSGFTDSYLPTHLETRFQKLKSFPSANSKPVKSSSHCGSTSSSVFNNSKNGENSVHESGSMENLNSGLGSIPTKSLSFSDKDEIFQDYNKFPGRKKDLKAKSESEFFASASNSFDFSAENETISSSKKISSERNRKESKSPSVSSDSSTVTLSPPQKSGCLCCSSIMSSRKKNKENRVLDSNLDWGKTDEVFSDLNTFSGKNQKKLLKKTMKEEEKISKEAEKIVKWAKQASARMTVSGIEDELSDSESSK